jgi:hypothetical protein
MVVAKLTRGELNRKALLSAPRRVRQFRQVLLG